MFFWKEADVKLKSHSRWFWLDGILAVEFEFTVS